MVVVLSLVVDFVIFGLQVIDEVGLFRKVKPFDGGLRDLWRWLVQAFGCLWIGTPPNRTNRLPGWLEGWIVPFEALAARDDSTIPT